MGEKQILYTLKNKRIRLYLDLYMVYLKRYYTRALPYAYIQRQQ